MAVCALRQNQAARAQPNETRTAMDEQRTPTSAVVRGHKYVEAWLEALLFGGRWIMAPIYVGLLLVLAAITVKFIEEMVLTLPFVLSMKERDLVLFVLSLIDLALLGSLVLMVAFAGYENFVSRLNVVRGHEDRPDWMGHIDFSGLKLKLVSSIVAISAIHLLRTFLNVPQMAKEDVAWQLAIHLGFVVSGVLLAWMDRLSAAAVEATRTRRSE
jgi:uncharacterized protein (TIGR00645 family)